MKTTSLSFQDGVHSSPMKFAPRFVLHVALVVAALTPNARFAKGQEKAEKAEKQNGTFQVTGLFAPSRENDLKTVFATLSDLQLKSIDFANAEITVEFDPSKAFPGAKPEQYVERLDNLVRNASRYTFGIQPRRKMPLDQLTRIEIPAAGLDCRACELAAYEMVYKLPGVEMATANFREGRVVVYVRADVTDRMKIETVLRERGVTLGERTP